MFSVAWWKTPAQKKRNLENWLPKRFQVHNSTIHAREYSCFEIDPEVYKDPHSAPAEFPFQWFSRQFLWRNPTRKSWVSSFTFEFHSGSDWQFGVENGRMVARCWRNFRWIQNHSERSQKRLKQSKRWDSKITLENAKFFLCDITEKTTIDCFRFFQKHLSFVVSARPEIAGRRIAQETLWTGKK